MEAALVGSALLMGLAGTPHCAVMCGAPCAALSEGSPRSVAHLSFQAGRLLSYAAAGAVAASSVSLMAHWGQTVAWLRPLWLLLHLGALGLGLYLLWKARQPAWLSALGREGSRDNAIGVAALAAGGPALSVPRRPRWRSLLAGLGWVAWPCGLLQSALLLAALANGAAGGAAVMGAFALTSGLGLVVGPTLLWKLLGLGAVEEGRGMRWATRLGGLGLVLSAGWALGHGVWAQIQAYCA